MLAVALPVGVLPAAEGEPTEPAPQSRPLHHRIDQLIQETAVAPFPQLASDEQFLRRIYLDLVGTVPTFSEQERFRRDSRTDKRARLVDRLLQDVRFDYHFRTVLNVMLMERRADQQIKRDAWEAYLLSSLQNQKPLNQLAREILAADGASSGPRAAVKFYLDRQGDPNLITRDVGRIFFGRDLQCAQCHDHPQIATYYQADYYGLFAFFNRSFIFTDPKKKVFYAEKAEGEVEFTSVFTGEEGQSLPRLPGGEPLRDPELDAEALYEVKPEKNVRPIPTYSRRQQLALQATDGSNAAFNENLANRLWAHMMGRGLVHPVDLMHADNPPSHPRLLRLLGRELATMEFDLREFLRQLALSSTYQRRLALPAELTQFHASAKQDLAQVQRQSTELEAAATEVEAQRETTLANVADLSQRLASLEQQQAAADQQRELAERKLASTRAKLAEQTQLSQQTAIRRNAFAEAEAAVQKAAHVADREAALQEAAALFAQRHLQLEKRQEQLHAVIGQAQQQAQQLQAAVTQAQADAAEATAAREASQSQLEAAELEFRELERRREELQLRLDQLAMKRQALELLARATHRSETQKAAAQARDEALAEEQAARLAEQQAVQQQASLAAERQRVDAELEQLRPQIAAMSQDVTRRQAAQARLSAATDALTAAQSLLAGETELAQTLQQVQAQRNRLDTQRAELATQLAPLETRCAALETQRSQQGRKLQAAQQQLEICRARREIAESRRVAAEQRWLPHAAELTRYEDALVEQAERQFLLAGLRPLTPEQLAWSLMTATGVVANTRQAVINELKQKQASDQGTAKEKSASEEGSQESTSLAGGEREAPQEATIEAQVRSKLAGVEKLFVSLFANAAGQPQDVFFATVEQSLFFMNGGQLRGWIAQGGDSVRRATLAHDDPAAMARQMYLTTLSRPPSVSESQRFAHFLSTHDGGRDAAVQEWLWGLLTSNEFRFNH